VISFLYQKEELKINIEEISQYKTQNVATKQGIICKANGKTDIRR
jgi:hypothetical protein